MYRVIHHAGNTDIPLCAWFVHNETAKEYAEALKDTSDSYTITFVPKNQMSPWDAWFTVIED
jgi:hypothetical protein